MTDNNKSSKISYKTKKWLSLVLLSALILVACGNDVASGNAALRAGQTKDTGFIITKAGMYDSADTDAIVVSTDTEDGTVTFYNRDVKKEYTLKFDGTSKIYDKYGTSMSMEQVKEGSIVNITFLKGKRLINSMTLSSDAWEYEKNKNFSIDSVNKEMTINGARYVIDDNAYIYLDGREASLMDINAVDSITIRGLERKVHSIEVEDGHGYLRLKNEDYFVGGWIEVGSKIIRTIGEDMIIAVPIGTYDVALSKNSVSEVKTISIDRNMETTLDLGDVEIEEEAIYGTVIFVTTPEEASVFIDGNEIDKSQPQRLEYGIHQMIARADGYESLTQYIKVGQEAATLDITLEKDIVPITPTPLVTPSVTPTPETVTPTGAIVKITPAVTISPSVTPSVSVTPTPTVTVTPTLTVTPTPTPSITLTPSVTVTPTPIEIVTPTVTPVITKEAEPSEAVTPSVSVTPGPEVSPEVTEEADVTPEVREEEGEAVLQPEEPSEVIEAKEGKDGKYTMNISGPSGAEVYLNGDYVGTAPTSITKEEGTYELTFRKEGYVTRSYTIGISSSEGDKTVSFADLDVME